MALSGHARTVLAQALTNADVATELADMVDGALPGGTSTQAIANGGTGQTTAAAAFNALSPLTTLGDTLYGAASGAGTRLAGNATATKKFLSQTGNGSVSAAPSWSVVAAADVGAVPLSGNVGFFGTTATTQQADGAALTNSVAASGTTNTIPDFTSLTVYGTDAQAIHDGIYQLARKVKIIDDALRAYGLLT